MNKQLNFIFLISAVMFFSCNEKTSIAAKETVDGKPHFVVAVYDASLNDTPQLRIDAIYRIIKDTMIVADKNTGDPKVKAYRDTSYYIPQRFSAMDATGKKVLKTNAGLDSSFMRYVNVSPVKIIKDGGTIDSAVAHYQPKKQPAEKRVDVIPIK